MANTISPSSFRTANLSEILKAISPAVNGAPEMEAAATLLQTLNLSPDQWAQIAERSALNTAALRGTSQPAPDRSQPEGAELSSKRRPWPARFSSGLWRGRTSQ